MIGIHQIVPISAHHKVAILVTGVFTCTLKRMGDDKKKSPGATAIKIPDLQEWNLEVRHGQRSTIKMRLSDLKRFETLKISETGLHPKRHS